MPNNCPTAADVVEQARRWIGTEYMHRQRSFGRYTDCVGLVIGVARTLRVGDYKATDYAKNPDPVRMRRDLHEHLDDVGVREPRPGEILWLRVRRDPSHLAIVAEHPDGVGLSMIHAHSTVGRVVEHRLDKRWLARLESIFRYRGVAY